MAMDKVLKNKWVQALRSGDFKQTAGTLVHFDDFDDNDDNVFSYCCLGVLCEISPFADIDGGGFHLDVSDADLDEFGQYIDDDLGAYGEKLWGLAPGQETFLVTHNDGTRSAECNPDGEQWNFNQIAKWIEDNIAVKEKYDEIEGVE